MKHRSRAFDCPIAGRTVGISLRHGGGLQEPGKVYVRCDERDCQYVDLNEPPCPLRVDMFADGSDLRVAQHLAAQGGQHICYACLTDALGVTHEQVRRATWRLREEIGLVIRPSRCGSCHRRRVTIGLPTGVAVRSAEAPVPPRLEADEHVPGTTELADYLRRHPGFFFCAHCLGRELGAAPSVMREAMWALEHDPAFPIRTAQCVSCLLVKCVVRHEQPVDELSGARRLVQFIAQASGVGHCATCLAFATDLPLADVRRALTLLEGALELHRREATCAVCGRWQTVVSAPKAGLDQARQRTR